VNRREHYHSRTGLRGVIRGLAITPQDGVVCATPFDSRSLLRSRTAQALRSARSPPAWSRDSLTGIPGQRKGSSPSNRLNGAMTGLILPETVATPQTAEL